MRFLFLFLLAFFSCSKSEPPREKVIPVQVVSLEKKDSFVYLDTHGVLSPFNQAEVRSGVSGRICKIFCKEGQNVQKGDLLATIDPSLYELKLQEAKAAFSQKELQLEFVQKKIDRHLSLQKPHLAAIEFDALKQEASLLKASLTADAARVKQAEINVESCSLRAPISGIIGKISFGEQQWITESSALSTIRDVDSLYVEFALTETELLRILEKASSLSKIDLEIRSTQNFPGHFVSLDNRIDPRSGTILAKGILENPNHTLWPGQHVSLRLLLDSEQDLQFLPIEAIQQNSSEKFVYVVRENQVVEMRPVCLGKVEGKEVVILSGLEPTDQVVTKGQMRLYPGAKVEIKP